MADIAILTVNWRDYDFFELMYESLERFTEMDWEIICVDNNPEPKELVKPRLTHHKTGSNLGHGKGLNVGAQLVTAPYVLVLDVDCHLLRSGWEAAFLGLMEDYDIVGGRGVPQKPLRPACMFMKNYVVKKYDWRDTPGYKGHRVTPEGFDVAIQAYYQILEDKTPFAFIEAAKNSYGTLNGEDWCVGGVPYVYHHWHGTHLKERKVDFPKADLEADKQMMFSKIPWRML